MKQKLFDWIYRSLRKMGIKSTEYINLNDFFQEALKISDGQKYICVKAEIHRRRPDRDTKLEIGIYDERYGHHNGVNTEQVLGSFKESAIRGTKNTPSIEEIYF